MTAYQVTIIIIFTEYSKSMFWKARIFNPFSKYVVCRWFNITLLMLNTIPSEIGGILRMINTLPLKKTRK